MELDIPSICEAIARDRPAAPCLVHGGQTSTWGRTAERTRRLAAVLGAAGLGPVRQRASRLTLGTCILYLRQDKQPAHRSARWQCDPPLASCVSLSYLKLDGKRSTLPAYLGPIPYGQDHTRTIDGRRPGHRDGDALVQLLQPGAMVGKSVITR